MVLTSLRSLKRDLTIEATGEPANNGGELSHSLSMTLTTVRSRLCFAAGPASARSQLAVLTCTWQHVAAVRIAVAVLPICCRGMDLRHVADNYYPTHAAAMRT